MNVLLIIGSDRSDRYQQSGQKVGIRGHTDLHKLIPVDGPLHRLQLTPHFFRQVKRPSLGDYDCLFNTISEAEDNERVLDVLRKLARNHHGRLINRPEAVLRTSRDQVARRLSGIEGLNVPRLVRLKGGRPEVALKMIDRAGLHFPIILRRAGTHTGKILGLFERPEAMEAALATAGDLIATEFVDFRSSDGWYRKYRVYFIGTQRILRHLLVFDHWNIHARAGEDFMMDKPEFLAEQERLFERTEGAFPESVHAVMRAVRAAIDLDYFGMDFALGQDGRPILFEANATMNFFPFRTQPQVAYMKRCIGPARRAFGKLLGLDPEHMDDFERRLAIHG